MRHLFKQHAGIQDSTGASGIVDDEPVLVLRGSNPAAQDAARVWAAYLMHKGARPELVRAVQWWADEMLAYAAAHPETRDEDLARVDDTALDAPPDILNPPMGQPGIPRELIGAPTPEPHEASGAV